MAKKKVTIKFHKDASIEILSKDKDVVVVIETPDGFEREIFDGEKMVWKDDEGFGGRLSGLS